MEPGGYDIADVDTYLVSADRVSHLYRGKNGLAASLQGSSGLDDVGSVSLPLASWPPAVAMKFWRIENTKMKRLLYSAISEHDHCSS